MTPPLVSLDTAQQRVRLRMDAWRQRKGTAVHTGTGVTGSACMAPVLDLTSQPAVPVVFERRRMRTRESSTDGRAGGIAPATVQAGGQNGSIRRLDAEERREVPGVRTAQGRRPLVTLTSTRAACLSNRASVSTAAALKRGLSLVGIRDWRSRLGPLAFGAAVAFGLVCYALAGFLALALGLSAGLILVALLRLLEALP